ncbi:MAG: Rieske 2Fe-2S domain-containing protein [Pseudomonadota bacterium]
MGEDRWVGVGLEGVVRPLSSHPVEVDGIGLCVWRGQTGPARVWEDRCPHRGMRLSFGFVRGDELTCLYHGWRYNGEGQCTAIPAHPDVTPAKAICTSSFAAETRGGIVFANLSEKPEAPAPEAPEGNWQAVRSVAIGLGAEAVAGRLTEDGLAGAAVEALAEGLYRAELDGQGTALIALQPISAAKTALHLSFCASSGGKAVQARLGLARALVDLRTALEQEG